jgi:hypothetical protein
VRRAVVEHEMHLELGGDLAVDGRQELLELDNAPMTLPVVVSRAA